MEFVIHVELAIETFVDWFTELGDVAHDFDNCFRSMESLNTVVLGIDSCYAVTNASDPPLSLRSLLIGFNLLPRTRVAYVGLIRLDYPGLNQQLWLNHFALTKSWKAVQRDAQISEDPFQQLLDLEYV
ncbi:hypothetical protein LTR78_009443 [Recurvomyces mirabilis]|uniref:Uncharacterized protein n=1 Tax=Recurvomyces mirabilis TaxID=574656 RepID=A0AAE0TS90_9PEZI|nr:hypothetical protein LTR78_009443 [Recurvomyces mirabilis]KAK5152348.1 hypothetical protein LTS14_008295 [Recurvomyces mirabilis]